MLQATPPELTIIDRVIALVGGIILLGVSYAAIVARRATDPEVQQRHRRLALQGTMVFLGFAYMAAVLVPDSVSWPADIGDQLRLYFNELDTVPATADDELTDFYRVIADKVGVATGTSETSSPAEVVLDPVRTLGLVVYTVLIATASLGVKLPRRLWAGLQTRSRSASGSKEGTQSQDDR